jgi:DNA-binding response OmpR family regulator
MVRLLLVDDDPALLDILSMALEDAGYAVQTAPDGQAAWDLISRGPPPALLISDINMPRLDGFVLCKRVKERPDPPGVLLLSSRDSEMDEALGLELGADDYMAKPLRLRALLARVALILRRNAPPPPNLGPAAANQGPMPASPDLAPRVLGALQLDPLRLLLTWRSQPISATVTEFRLIELLAGRPGVVFSRERLLEGMRGDDSVVAERIVDTYIRRMRRKFEAVDPDFERIETIIGAGYRWRA